MDAEQLIAEGLRLARPGLLLRAGDPGGAVRGLLGRNRSRVRWEGCPDASLQVAWLGPVSLGQAVRPCPCLKTRAPTTTPQSRSRRMSKPSAA